PRAVEMATFNARLNRLANVTAVQGDLFDPVAGRRFDLIVSNPPFIISPDSEHLFLYSGLGGDEACRRIVGEAPRFLTDGGLCQLLANWALRKGEDWEEWPRQWARGTGCDLWVLRRATHPVDEYAATWIERDDRSGEGFAGAFAEWMNYYDGEGIECIVGGVIAMRRRRRARRGSGPTTPPPPCRSPAATTWPPASTGGTCSPSWPTTAPFWRRA
ncbi:MAG TPA: methyltransferase, partial [Acidimicrobiales bacterium]|nr:methyltransferase [Acidimicrobiales bacterium]